jgi:ssDNA-binding Zn-finger/Zn-ribbon topoisomerase 1
MTADFGNRKSLKGRSDPLAKMPPLLKKWAEKKGLDRLLARYGWSTCKVCGRIGIPWYTAKLPQGINLDFESPRTGWLHPPGDGTESGYGFGDLWKYAQEESEKTGQSIDQVVAGLEQTLFDGFMRSVANTAWMGHTPEQMTRGSTNLFDFCIYSRMVLWARQGGKRGACPKCGEPGTGEGKVGNERRFFHESNRSCYLGMFNPVRKQATETKCPKCGEPGRESVSKGYKYIRHKNKTCYVGKISDELP